MPSYVENTIQITSDTNPNNMLKPILFADYTIDTKYNVVITYEDSTTKTVEIIQNDKNRPYKVVYKKEGKLVTVIGIPKVYPIHEESKYCDFVNRTLDSKDLLFEMDCSDKYECSKARFYLKDIRDIVDLVAEGLIPGTEDPGEVENPDMMIIHSLYPIYVNEKSCTEVIECEVDENLKVILTSKITNKLGEELLDTEYSRFMVLSVESPVMLDYTVFPEVNKIPLVFTEDSLDKEIKIIIRYFVNEINHPVFDEFTIKATKPEQKTVVKSENGLELNTSVTTQDPQYLGDNSEEILDLDYTPGYKVYREYE